jgi:NhaP-type Na+/H+ or K+/H+ antiporter
MNPRQQSIIVGAILGAGLGALGGYLFTRNMDMDVTLEGEESMALATPSVHAGDVVKLVISVLAVLRGIAELADRN